MNEYRQHALEGASPVDLVVALYDGIIRFLYSAIDAVERGDTSGRRAAAKRALDIIIHLQARLRMDVGGRPAESLSEFYAAIFAQILQASQHASKPMFEHAVDCVRNVRDAWRVVAKDPAANPSLPDAAALLANTPAINQPNATSDLATGSRWTA
jgi:flagellar protein FliS